jgi:hypothetical protein
MAGSTSGVQTGETIVSLGYNALAIEAAVTAEVSFIPILNVVMFALDILELAGIIPNPISLLIQAFSGRPREEATAQQAGRLMNARNPAARIAGITLERMLTEWGIVTSETGSGRVILNAWASQFTGNLTGQGVPLDRARQILVHATSEAAQSGLPLEPELQQPLAPQYAINGTQETLDFLTQQYKNAIAKGMTIGNSLNFAEQRLFKNYKLNQVLKLQIGTYIPPQPPPQEIIPSQDGTCPNGYTLNSVTELCELVPPPPGTGGGGGGGGGGGQVDPDGDEITNTLCAQLGNYNQALLDAISGLAPGGGTDEACCQNIVNAIGNVATALTSILSAVSSISGTNPNPVDLTGVVGALDGLISAVSGLAPAGSVDFSPIVQALNDISNKIGGGAPENTEAIAKALQDANTLQDVPHAIVQQFFSDGVLPQEYTGILQGTPWSWVHAALIAAARVSPIIGFVEHVLGDDADFSAALRANREAAKAGVAALMKLNASIPALPPEASTNHLSDIFKKFFTVSEATLGPIIKPVVDSIADKLTGSGTPALGAYPVQPDDPIADATGAALGAATAGWLAAYAGIDEGEPLAKIVEYLAGAVGFEELRDVKIGPLVRNGIGRVAEMQARAQFQQEIPGVGQTTDLVARGLLEGATASRLLDFNGLHTSVRAAVQSGAYSGMQARMLIRVNDSGLFSPEDLRDELTFGGMRPASQQRFLAAAPWLSTQPERNQLRATLEQAYVQGFFTDASLSEQLDQLNQNTDRDALVMARVQLQKRMAFAKKLEAAYRKEFAANVISDVQYGQLLLGIGLEQDWINNEVAEQEALMNATFARQAAAVERALERATAAEERKAATRNFLAGNTDQTGLLAALLLTGLNATQAAAWVDLATLQLAGSRRLTYGRLLPPEAATLLHSRVAALSDQRKRELISAQEYFAALSALGIPQPFLNTLRATTEAMISPKTGATMIPVSTT